MPEKTTAAIIRDILKKAPRTKRPSVPDRRVAVRRSAGAARRPAAAQPVPAAVRTVAPADCPPLVRLCVDALDEKKAEYIRIVDVRKKSSVTNYLVVATATSEPHLRALRIAAEKALADAGMSSVRSDAKAGSGWFVVDAFDVMIHLFLKAQRDAYKIEELWTVKNL